MLRKYYYCTDREKVRQKASSCPEILWFSCTPGSNLIHPWKDCPWRSGSCSQDSSVLQSSFPWDAAKQILRKSKLIPLQSELYPAVSLFHSPLDLKLYQFMSQQPTQPSSTTAPSRTWSLLRSRSSRCAPLVKRNWRMFRFGQFVIDPRKPCCLFGNKGKAKLNSQVLRIKCLMLKYKLH